MHPRTLLNRGGAVRYGRSVATDRVAMHRALEASFESLYASFDGASFERRDGLYLALYPRFPIPQCNGAWIVEDSQAAVDALPGAIAEVEAAGAVAWIQTRTGHDRTRQAALELGLTHAERVPGMAMRPGELVEPNSDLEIRLTSAHDADETNELLAVSFGAPKELFDAFNEALARIESASWYIGRAHGQIVTTAIGFTAGDSTGVFNVGTSPDKRGRGYGAAITARVVRDGFAAGSELAFLQSSEVGHGVYRRLGFRDVEEYVLLTRPG
jgi:N-acetylglutamate synthase-like GNAT family acetyltransferase